MVGMYVPLGGTTILTRVRWYYLPPPYHYYGILPPHTSGAPYDIARWRTVANTNRGGDT